MRRSWPLLLALLAACTDKPKNDSAPLSPPPTPTATASTAPTTTPTNGGPREVPRAEDLVPQNEVVAGSIAIDGELFRYQAPAEFKMTNEGAWQGTVTGAIDDATITLSAASRKFKGDIDVLVSAETKDATDRGAKIELSGPVLVWVGGKVEPARGRRLLAHFSDRFDYRVLVVRAPNAFVFHCETAATPDAWKNVGAICMARGNTFHIAPPAR